MSVTNVCEAATSSSGQRGRGQERKYTAPYNVTVDDAADDAKVIQDWFESNGYAINTPYSYSGSTDIQSFLDGINPQRKPGSVTEWLCTLTYSPLQPQEDREDEQGNPTSDPLEWRMDHSIGYSAWQEPAWAAQNVDAFPLRGAPDGSVYERAELTVGPIVNSAGVVLDPTLMRDVFDRVWQIRVNKSTYESEISDQYIGRLNNDQVTLHPDMVTYYNMTAPTNPWAQDVIKCTSVGGTYRRVNDVSYWEWHWEFRFRSVTWLEHVLDRGIAARATDGGPDGTGGQFGTPPAGAAAAMPVLDPSGRRVPELVLFNGRGYPVTAGSVEEKEGVYCGWLKDGVNTFANIPFPFFVASP